MRLQGLCGIINCGIMGDILVIWDVRFHRGKIAKRKITSIMKEFDELIRKNELTNLKLVNYLVKFGLECEANKN